MIEKLDILAFAAHPDDVELGASGTVIKHIDAGYKVGIIDLTRGELGSRGTIDTRFDEANQSSQIMGLKVRKNLGMADGLFEINEENKHAIIREIRRYQPRIVLANAVSDRHPDHGRAGQLVSEACFLSGLRKYVTELEGAEQEAYRPEAVYHYIQDHYHTPDFVIDVTAQYERKMAAIKAFKTQFYDPESTEPETPISGEDFLDFVISRMKEIGRQAGYKYAEGFTVERFIGVKDFFDLD